MYKVRFQYNASEKTDINLHVGDTIANVEDVGNGWSMGHNKATGKTGTFPTHFIMKKASFKDRVKRMSIAKKAVDQLSKERSDSTSNLVPNTKAKVPDQVLQRRLTHVPGHQNVMGVKLPKMVPKPVKSFGNNLLQSNRGEHRILKGLFGIFGGFLACGILFVLLHYSYDYTTEVAGYITAGAAVPICTALALSTHMRCIILLMVPSMFTGKGRAVFMSIIFALLLSGPVVNITYNAQQASESMACTQELIYNQTLILKKQLEEPIRKIEQFIYDGLVRLQAVANDIKNAIAPVTNAVDDFVNGLNAAKNALETAAQKCDSGLKTAQTECENGINNAKSECEKALKSIDPTDDIINFGKDVANTGESVVRSIGDGFRRVFGKKRKRRRALTEEEVKAIYLASQMIGKKKPLEKYGIYLRPRNAEKIINQTAHRSRLHALKRYKRFTLLDKICVVLDISAVCQVVQVGQIVCTPLKYISKAIESASNGIKSALDSVISFFYFDFDGNIGASGNINSSKTAAQIIAEVKADIVMQTSGILTAANIISNVLTLTLLFLFIKSIFYLKKFLSKDRYDNFYITKSFKQYDHQCKDQGKPSVLPLKRKERKKYVDTRSCWLSSREIAKSKKGFAKVAIHLLIATVIIFFDYVLYFVLQLIDKYGNLNINIGGNTYLDVSVDGTGFIAAFLSAFLSTISLNSDFGVDFNLTTCIPNPSPPDSKNIYIFCFLYIFAFVFLIMQAYGLRLRRKIATFFYPERDIERIKYLHEKIRHRRKTLLNWLTNHIVSRNKQFHVENRITLRGWIEYRCPRFAKYFCPCLPKYKTCLSCSCIQDGTIKFHKCQKCSTDYCDECFGDMQYNCLVCNTKMELALQNNKL